MASHRVKFGSVSIEVKPWRHPSGRDYWKARYYDQTGKRQEITRADLGEAKKAAMDKAVELSKGTVDLNKLPAHVVRSIRRMLDADPSLALVDEFLAWKAKEYPQKPVSEAVGEFLALKDANKGRSIQNLRTLRRDLDPLVKQLGAKSLGDITISDLEAIINQEGHGNRTRRNRRASMVTFFRWCSARGYLPEGKTVAEKTETPIVADTIPETYSPKELQGLLKMVLPQYLPWLALSAFAGVRREEMYPLAGGTKSPLDWSDIKWDRELIEVRPETAKTKRRRIIPLQPALKAILEPLRRQSGPICTGIPPHKQVRGAEAETQRLGKPIGGWRRNALRHSFISYRAAIVGLGQTAMEAGNSESEARRSYNDAKGKDEALQWFKVGTAGNKTRKSLK